MEKDVIEFLTLGLVAFAIQGLYRSWGKPTFDAMPAHLDEAHEWNGKDDDDHWYTRFRKRIKGWFAFGPRSDYAWARFREFPKTLFFITNAPADVRYENNFTSFYAADGYEFFRGGYASRVQYQLDWHIALEWPLFLHSHIGLWQFYVGFKRDGDRIYWLSFYIGRVWK